MTTLTEDTRRNLALIAIVVLGIVIRLTAWRGFGALDDAEYARFAYALSGGGYPLLDYTGPPVFPLRLGIILPTSLLFKAFGVHEWTMVGFPFFISVIGIILAYWTACFFFSTHAGLLAAFFWAVLPVDSFHASILVPDPVASFFAGSAIVLLFYLLYRPPLKKPFQFGGSYAVGLLFGYSWLCKESLANLFPFVLFLFLWSLRKANKNRISVWVAATGGLLTVLIAELILYWSMTGDPLFRLHAIERNIAMNPSAFGLSSDMHQIVKRILITGPLTILDSPQFLYLILFGLLGGVYALYWKDRSFGWPLIWLVALILVFNFGSVTFKQYLPLVLFNRYLYPLFLPAIVITSGFLIKLWNFGGANGKYDEQAMNRERHFWAFLISVCLVCTALYQNYKNTIWASDWTTAVATVSGVITPQHRVYTDILSIQGLEFFWHYPDSKQTVNFEDIRSKADIENGSYVLINEPYLDWLIRMAGWWPNLSGRINQLDIYKDIPEHWQLVWQGHAAHLYKTPAAKTAE